MALPAGPDRRRRPSSDRRRFPRCLRARVHLPARRAGRVRRRAPRRDRRGRQARRPAPLPTTRPPHCRRSKGRRRVDYATEGIHEAEIYDGEMLEPGMGFTGPAIVETRARRSSSIPATKCRSTTTATCIIALALRDRRCVRATATRRSDHPRDHPELARGDQRRDVRGDSQDRDERDHLRGARHGHRRSPTRGASSRRRGAGIPAFVGVLDKAVKRDHRAPPEPETIAPGRHLRHQRSLLRRGDASQRRRARDARVRRRASSIAWTANIAHWNDVGGMVPGSISTEASEIFQEGLRLPGGQADRRRASRTSP